MVVGIGGIFLIADDARTLADWYRKHLGIAFGDEAPDGAFAHAFTARDNDDPQRTARLILGIFPRTREPREPSSFSVNYRVQCLDDVLEHLRAAGIGIENTADFPYGRFAWCRDPEGNRIELFEDLTMNERAPSGTPHPPYEDLRVALGDHPEGHAALEDLRAALHDAEPREVHLRASVDRLRNIPAIEANIANWWDSPRTQNWLKILNDAGL